MNLAELPCEVVYWCNYLTVKDHWEPLWIPLEPGNVLTILLQEGPVHFTLVCLLSSWYQRRKLVLRRSTLSHFGTILSSCL